MLKKEKENVGFYTDAGVVEPKIYVAQLVRYDIVKLNQACAGFRIVVY